MRCQTQGTMFSAGRRSGRKGSPVIDTESPAEQFQAALLVLLAAAAEARIVPPDLLRGPAVGRELDGPEPRPVRIGDRGLERCAGLVDAGRELPRVGQR